MIWGSDSEAPKFWRVWNYLLAIIAPWSSLIQCSGTHQRPSNGLTSICDDILFEYRDTEMPFASVKAGHAWNHWMWRTLSCCHSNLLGKVHSCVIPPVSCDYWSSWLSLSLGINHRDLVTGAHVVQAFVIIVHRYTNVPLCWSLFIIPCTENLMANLFADLTSWKNTIACNSHFLPII